MDLQELKVPFNKVRFFIKKLYIFWYECNYGLGGQQFPQGPPQGSPQFPQGQPQFYQGPPPGQAPPPQWGAKRGPPPGPQSPQVPQQGLAGGVMFTAINYLTNLFILLF